MNKRPYRGRTSSNTIKYKPPPKPGKKEYYPPFGAPYPPPRSRPHPNPYHFSHPYPPLRPNPSPSSQSSQDSSLNPRLTFSSGSKNSTAHLASPKRKHRRDPSAASIFSNFSSVTGTSDPQTPKGRLQLSPERRPSRFPPFDKPNSIEFSPYPFHSPGKKSNQSIQLSPSGHSFDSLFPNSAIKSPQRSSRRKEKNVTFGLLEDEVFDKVDSPKDKGPSSLPHLHQPYFRRYPHPPPNYHLRYLKDPLRHIKKPNTMQQENSSLPTTNTEGDNSHPSSSSGHVISTTDSHGVEMGYNAESDSGGPYSRIVRNDSSKKKSHPGDKNDTPPREKTSEAGKKVNMISPPDTQSHHGHSRSASYNTLELTEVPGGEFDTLVFCFEDSV